MMENDKKVDTININVTINLDDNTRRVMKLLLQKVDSETYEHTFRCWNCRKVFKKDIEKGIPTFSNGGICPKCGMRDAYKTKDGSSTVRYHDQ